MTTLVSSESPSCCNTWSSRSKSAVGIRDGVERGRAVDAGIVDVRAVALVVLRAVGIARPEDEHERLAAPLEFRQDDLCRDVGEIVLLRAIAHLRAGGAVGSARRRLRFQAGLCQCL